MHPLLLALLITIRLYDTSGVPPRDLHTATTAAAEVFQRASLRPTWVVCPSPADAANASGCGAISNDVLVVRIVRTPLTAEAGDVLGYASIDTTIHHGVLATVYGDRVEALAAQAGVDRGTVLGHAIAHEVGHLLLGTTAHGQRGLMRPRWSLQQLQQERGPDWWFSNRDAKALLTSARAFAAPVPAPPRAVLPDQSASRGASESLRAAPVSDLPSARMP